MEIKCFGTISIVHTEQKPLKYKRKGYYLKGKWVKPKKITRLKEVPIKEPYLTGYISLEAKSDTFHIGDHCIDNNGLKYLCIQRTNISEIVCYLRIINSNLGKTFTNPKELTCIARMW